jgi:hypothetical protein
MLADEDNAWRVMLATLERSSKQLRIKQTAAPPPGADPLEFTMSDGSVDRMGDVMKSAMCGWLSATMRKPMSRI